MAYTKLNFDETIPASKDNLDHVETQYDEAIADVGNNMADSTKRLSARVLASFPTLAQGQIFLHTGMNKFYYSTTTEHKILAEPGQSQAVIA